MINIAVFVSGGGTNCERLIQHFKGHNRYKISLVVSNKKDAPAIEKAERYGVKAVVMEMSKLNNPKEFLPLMTLYGIKFIVLAGFLPIIPDYLIEAFPNRIINLHPALLPKFGGKGMWGHHVHEAVKQSGDTQTGMTVHFVTSVCDGGQIIAQVKCDILPSDTVDDIASQEHELEMRQFPIITQEVLDKSFNSFLLQ